MEGGEAGTLLQAWLGELEEGSSSAMTFPADDPARLYRIICPLLLRKARIHALAVLQANEANNVHSLALQMRRVLECAGQFAFIFHNLLVGPYLLMEPEHAANTATGYMDADYYRTIIGAARGSVGHEELRQTDCGGGADARAGTGGEAGRRGH